MGKSQELYNKAKKLIPGGTQLLSKRPEMFLPDLWPAYYDKACGCEVWDLDGNKYIDMATMGIGACILGYADEDVNQAVQLAVQKGSMTSLNAPEEVELAKVLIDLHPWAEMVRYARTGGEAMVVAVRIARAKARKDIVLFCGYHGWHDWYLSANIANERSLDGHLLPGLNPLGVPRKLHGTSYPFKYNDAEGFLKLISKYKENIGVVVLESVRNNLPEKGFLETIRNITRQNDIILVLDEITSGWRLNLGGAHLLFNLQPDIAVFGKGISNGFPMAAILGKASVMEAAQESFISSTYWTERIGPAASLAAIRKMRTKQVQSRLVSIGQRVKAGWKEAAAKHNLRIDISGIDPLLHFYFKDSDPLILKTLFTQLMLEKGYLATTALYASFAHEDKYLEAYLRAIEETFAFISKAVLSGTPNIFLNAPVCHAGFKRLT